MRRITINILFAVFSVGYCTSAYSQGATCATAVNLTTNTTATCTNFTTTASTGSAPCSGQGFGGSGFNNWFKFCTDAQSNCIQLDFSPITLTGGYSMVIYSDCNGTMVPGQTGGNACNGSGGPTTWTSTGLGLAPNTCYYMNIWATNAGTFRICSKKNVPPPNDNCSGAAQVNSAPLPANNFCYTSSPSDPPPSTFCALSDENSSWFVFTAQCNGSVTLNITNINCVGGAGGFQIGFYTGTCGNLTNIGCNTGSGGTVTTTVNNLTAGQSVYILIDGNAGSNCSWNISATNTAPTITPPVTICAGQSTTLTAYGGTTYSWSPGGATTASITVSPTATTTYTCVINNCTSTTLSTTVTVNQPVTPTFAQVAPICVGGTFSLPTTSTNGITGTWSPAINTQTTTTYTFTPAAGSCATNTTMTVQVGPATAPTFTAIAPICRGGSITLPTTSNNGIGGTWSPAINNTATTTYTFTPTAGQCASTATLTVTVNQPVTPTFNSISAICNGGSFTLPGTSNNGITGSWSPAVNNTATTLYTFTPTAGQCANTTTLTVTVNQPVTPTFTPIAPICVGGAFTLPAASTNGVNGSWSPAINNQATTTYTFTPVLGSCATTATMTVTVNSPVTPTFTQVSAICAGASFTLPSTSNNNINGSWSPAIDNQNSTTYTFTPANGTCATTTQMTVTVNPPSTVPTFSPIGPICSGSNFTLPGSSTNGISGTWSPAVNNTSSTTYIFTPLPGSCAVSTQLTVTIDPPQVPTFTQVAAICKGGSFTLPNTSNNGINGTWSPVINNQITTNYTFTPANGVCATTATMTVTVTQPTVPTFTSVAAICNGGSFTLPTTSNNGITGTWSPVINTAATTTYTFTPDNGLCATTTTMTVTVNQPTVPIFTQVAAICNGGSFTLPATSNNGIAGTWSPAIDNTITTTYTFTPNNGLCATAATMTVSVNQKTVPTFNQVPAVCVGGSFTLPTTSTNGITGTWSPVINNQTTTTYTFTPNAGACATTAQMTVTVNQPSTVPQFTPVADICRGGSFALPATSLNGITGTWSPGTNNFLTTTYTFTPSPGSCAVTTQMMVTVNQPQAPLFTQVSPICKGGSFTLPATSDNGFNGSWSPVINNQNTTTYTFTPAAGVCATSASMTVTVNQPATPTFPTYGPFCKDDILPQVMLPTTSDNGISGNWNPGMLSTAVAGNINYTFTPNASECAVVKNITVVVNAPVVATFTQIQPICNGGSINLPTLSNNGFNGSWSPAVDNTLSTQYTFTPNSGQCAAPAVMTVLVNQPVTPTFTPQSAICQGTAFALPSVSSNSITGAWSPAINTQSTTTYTFTPTATQCAVPTTMTVTVNIPVVPVFNPIADVCRGGSISLPSVSNNGISGGWSPVVNNQSTTTYTFTPVVGACATTAQLSVGVTIPAIPTFTPVAAICRGGSFSLPALSNEGITGSWAPAINNLNTTTYTFTPTTGLCAQAVQMTVTVNQPVTPTFTPVAAVCNGGSITLPASSLQGFNGTWSPAIDNTVTTTYTFTPAAGTCATTGQLTVAVNQPATPLFNQVAPICQGGNCTLPSVSLNGFSGLWSPAIDNQNTTTYTFTPTAGQCASPGQMTVVVNAPVVPTFNNLSPVCQGSSITLPSLSTNGFNGTWTPAINNNTTTTYTFTPVVGQCATNTATMTVVVNPPATPQFAPVSAICVGGAFALPTTSLDGFTGTWTPTINNQVTTTYYFTPTPGQCANSSASLTVPVSTNITPSFIQVDPICAGQALAALPTTSYNGINGSWAPAINNQNTTTYTFTPAAGQCANSAVNMTIVVNPIPAPPAVNTVQPTCTTLGSATISSLPGFIYSLDGGAFAATVAFDPLAAGNHSIIAQSAAGCNSAATNININTAPPVPAAPVLIPVQPTCTTPGSLSITAISGETYSLDGGAYSSTVAFNPLAAGSHTVTALNSSGCISAVSNVTILPSPPVPLAPNVTVTQPTCTVLGSVAINGLPGETYSFDGGPYLATLNYGLLTAGTYTIAAQNSAGCFSPVINVTIQPSPPIPSAPVLSPSQPTCTTSGSVSIAVIGGETYSLDGGAFTNVSTYNPIAPGSHTVIAQNSSGCQSAPSVFIIVAPPGIPSVPALTTTQPDCSVITGSISIAGITGEQYSFNNGPFVSSLSYSGLAPGNYSVVAQNASGCISSPAVVTIIAAPSIPSAPVANVSVAGCTTVGVLTITAVAGETYSIDGGPFVPTLVYSSLTPGPHTVTAQNSAGCVSSVTSVVIPAAVGIPATPILNVVQPTCTALGSISITAVAGLTYSFDGGAYSSTLTYDPVAAGSHTVIAQNGSGCTSSPAAFSILPSPAIPSAPAVAAVQPNCTISTGVINITGGAGLLFSLDGGNFSTNLSYASVAPGSHNVVAQNSAGCTSSPTNIIINQAPAIPLAPAIVAVQPDCIVRTGTVNISGVAGENYSLNGGAFLPSLSYAALAPGSYSVVAQNAAGCTSGTSTVVINNPPAIPAVPAVTPTQPACSTPGSISITGVPGLLYSLDGGAFVSVLNYPSVASGTHTVVAQNSDGCNSAPATVVIVTPPGIPLAPAVNVVQPNCTVATGSLTIAGVAGEEYSLDGSAYSVSLTYGTLSPGNHSITARNISTGCISAATMIAINTPPIVPPAPSVVSPLSICQGDVAAALTATGSGQLIWYSVATGGAGTNVAPLPSTSGVGTQYYYVSQTSGGCEGPRASIMVRVNVKPELGNPADVKICYGSVFNLNSLYGSGYNWTYAQQPVADPSAVSTPGTYLVTATNNFGCSDTNSVDLSIRPPVSAYAGPDTIVRFYTPYQLNGAGSGNQFTWIPGIPLLNNPFVPNPIAMLTEDTRFVLIVRDDYGCKAQDTVFIRVLFDNDFYVPTSFTPNGDGLNDEFSPVPLGGVAYLEYFRVFNRFGELVFETRDIRRRWNGTFRGLPQNIGNYVWELKGRNRLGEVKFLKGNVVLLR